MKSSIRWMLLLAVVFSAVACGSSNADTSTGSVGSMSSSSSSSGSSSNPCNSAAADAGAPSNS